MFCNNCGKEVLDGNAFCAGCGTKIEGISVAQNVHNETSDVVYDTGDKLSTLVVGILSTLALLFPIAGGIAWWYNKDKVGRKEQASTIGKFAIAGIVLGIVLQVAIK